MARRPPTPRLNFRPLFFHSLVQMNMHSPASMNKAATMCEGGVWNCYRGIRRALPGFVQMVSASCTENTFLYVLVTSILYFYDKARYTVLISGLTIAAR